MSSPVSSSTALIVVDPNPDEWRRIYQASNAVVLFNPTSHALAFHRDHPPPVVESATLCPYCNQPLPTLKSSPTSRAPNYFHLLSLANDVSSLPSNVDEDSVPSISGAIPSQSIAQGYFAAFFKEEYRLGMGANGSVYLCQHVLNGNPLGYFAVKKVAVGEYPEYLANLLHEVRLLETLHHPNIISYHHAWLESCQFSSFGPPIPTLHILMQWAEGGSLDEFIDARLGKAAHLHQEERFQQTDSPMDSGGSSSEFRSRSARIRAFRKNQRLSSPEREKRNTEKKSRGKAVAVHLFSAEEIKSIFSDIVGGLGFLHGKSILHLDLKPLNVLLTWDEGSLIPRAMLSDFGTSQDMLGPSRVRSGNTGTLEYSAPETVFRDANGSLQPIDSRADMWSLGMVLHKMVFFALPFTGEFERLEEDLLAYPGFKATPEVNATIKRRCLPRSVTVLLESLLNMSPFKRPTCEQVITAIREGKLDPLLRDRQADEQNVSLVPHKPPSPQESMTPAPLWENVRQPLSITDSSPTPSDPPPAPLPAAVGLAKESLVPSLLLPRHPTEIQVIKFTKSVLVLIKLVSLYYRCGARAPSALAVGAVVGIGLVDMWFQDWWSALYFGVVHVVLLSRLSLCCVA